MSKRKCSLGYFICVHSCCICFDDFEENSDHVPIILPCRHTLCNLCARQLTKHGRVKCPECRTKHIATDPTGTFSQNECMLTNVSKKLRQIEEQPTVKCEVQIAALNVTNVLHNAQQVKKEPSEFGKCDDQEEELSLERKKPSSFEEEPCEVAECAEHGKELNMFCKEEGCKKQICVSCLGKHKRHEVVDIQEEKKQELEQNMNIIEGKLEAMIRKILTAKEEIVIKSETFVTKLNKKKEEMDKKFDDMIKEVLNKLKTVKGIQGTIKEYMSGNRTYTYQVLLEGQFGVELVFGKIVTKAMNLAGLNGEQTKEAEADDVESNGPRTETSKGAVTASEAAGTTTVTAAVATATKAEAAIAMKTITTAFQLNCRGKYLIVISIF